MQPSRISVPAAFLSHDLRQAISRARELEVGGIEIDGRRGIDLQTVSQSALRHLRKWCADAGLVVSAIAFPTRGRLADLERLEARVAATKRAMELASGLGAGIVLLRPGAIPKAATDAEPASDWDTLREVLADLSRHGQRVGALPCLETGQAAPADLLRLITALPEQSLLVDLACGPLLVHGHDPALAAAQLAGQTGFVHASDAVPGSFAGHGRPMLLGRGQIDLPAVLAVLEERGFRGWIGIEPVTPQAGSPQSIAELAQAADILRAL
jgi:sugar phosphate isomerase/epimerase